jgi:hypothetical protein
MAKSDVNQKLPSLGQDFEPEVIKLIRLVTICSYEDNWPDATVAQVRKQLQQQYGRVPSLDALAARFGEETVIQEARAFLKERTSEIRETCERLGIGSPCHLCQAQRDDKAPHYEFGLACAVTKKTNWGGWAATLALNVVTVPFGAVVTALPGSTTQARIARCRLVFCERCAAQRRGFFGGLRATHDDCRRHPSWQRLHQEGFTRWLDREELAKFKPSS